MQREMDDHMKTTRILLAENSGVLSEAAARLRRMMRNISTGDCTVRSADTLEPLTRWHPDLVLLDPNRNECDDATPDPLAKAPSGASRVLVLSFTYDRRPEEETASSSTAVPPPGVEEDWHLASATVQSMEFPPGMSAFRLHEDLSSQAEAETAHAPCP
jgi:hypothetical protein